MRTNHPHPAETVMIIDPVPLLDDEFDVESADSYEQEVAEHIEPDELEVF